MRRLCSHINILISLVTLQYNNFTCERCIRTKCLAAAAAAAARPDAVVIGGKRRVKHKVLLAPLPACLVSSALDVKSGARLKATPDAHTSLRIGRSSGNFCACNHMLAVVMELFVRISLS